MKNLKIVFAVLTAIAFSAVAEAQTIDEVNAKLDEVAPLIEAKNYVAAIPLFEDIIKMGNEVGEEADDAVSQAEKNLPICYFQAAMGLAKEKKFSDAVVLFEKASATGKKNAPQVVANANRMAATAYFAMGGPEFNAKNYDKAVELLSKGYAIDPQNTKLAMVLAESYANLNQLDKAAEVFGSIIELGGKNPKFAEDATKAKAALATNLLVAAQKADEAGDFDGVVKFTGDVIKYDPSNATAPFMAIQVANKMKKYDYVIETADKAAEVQTAADDKSMIYFILGAAYQAKGDNAKAAAALRKVTSGPNAATAKQLATDLSK